MGLCFMKAMCGSSAPGRGGHPLHQEPAGVLL